MGPFPELMNSKTLKRNSGRIEYCVDIIKLAAEPWKD